MRSTSTEPRSIRSELVMLFAFAAVLLLFCGLGVLYWIVVRHAFEEDTAVLADKVAAIRADLDHPGGAELLNDELKAARAVGRTPYWVRVIDSSGSTIAESPGMSDRLAAGLFPNADRSRLVVEDRHLHRKFFSLVSTIVPIGGRPVTIQVAQDRSEDERFAKKFGALLAVVLVLGAAAAAVIAVTVAKRGLRPLERMAISLAHIGPTRLHERVPVTGWPRELQPLAAAFDELLDRL
ncbi:MAG: HAMP domain-containing protein, partial [Verrucomicrobiota bacterium]|nr:HAMP domain-containing protein [Verrucomicrobiota bacterium]